MIDLISFNQMFVFTIRAALLQRKYLFDLLLQLNSFSALYIPHNNHLLHPEFEDRSHCV